MADEKKPEVSQGQVHNNDYGSIRVDDDVVASVAAIVLEHTKGIANVGSGAADGLIGSVTDNFSGILGKKTAVKGVRVDYKDDGFTIILNIKVRYGHCIPDLAHEIQRTVKQEVETMTGMKVRSVDVFVQGIAFDTTDDEITEEQHA
ncbi:MAG: Asp23/Gls24 family envelope stress response protein [Peptococcaceae bacterium]|nr:Asp23/Gls24 family envelope stress response protein [Peptococcaceae bacterium]